MNPERRQLITLTEMAEFLGVSEDVLNNWCIENKIPYYEYNGSFCFSHIRVAKWVLDNQLGDMLKEETIIREERYQKYKNKGWQW